MDRVISLDEAQRKALMWNYLENDNGPVRIRSHMLLLLDDGRTAGDVAQFTFSTPEEVTDCVRCFREGGVEAIEESS